MIIFYILQIQNMNLLFYCIWINSIMLTVAEFNSREQKLCGLSACQALDISRQNTERTMVKMMRMIKPDALEQVFQNMNKVESLIRRVADLGKEINSLYVPVWPVTDSKDRWSVCTAGPCSCVMETKIVSCWRMELIDHVPRKQLIPIDTKFLDLSMNRLKHIHKDSFSKLNELSELDLNDNVLELLPNTVFYDLENLKHVKLQKNHIQYLYEDLFQDSRALQTIDISYNRIEALPMHIFQGLKNLKSLQISNNHITNLPPTLFDSLHNLQELDLSENKIENLPSKLFNNLHVLKSLQLGNNKISQIHFDVFRNLFSLSKLHIQNNEIQVLPLGLFMNNRNLTSLDFTSNMLSSISRKDFESLSKLQFLYLGGNQISVILNGTFGGTPNLKKLYLFSNKIESINLAAFSGMNYLTWLLLNNNLLKDLPLQIFKRTPNLLRLQIDSNKFMRLRYGILEDLKSVEQVKLSMNPWHCDCNILYLTSWLHRNLDKIWDRQPKCRGPGDLGGQPVFDMTFNRVCDGQWASMTNIKGRV